MDRCVLLFVAALAIYCFTTVVVGRFTATDEVAFKAAGREWAQSGRFAAPELKGFLDLDPPAEKVWFGHMPVYTFAFGVFVKLFGFTAATNVLFDALVHVLLAALTFALAIRVSSGSRCEAALLAGLAILPITNWGRADELAACFGVAALLTLRSSRVASGFLLGCCAATNVIAAAFFGVVCIGAQFARRGPRPIRASLTLLVASLSSAVALVSPLLIRHPEAIRQFLSHGARQLPDYGYGLAFTLTYGRPLLLSIAAGVIITAAAALRYGRTDLRHLSRLAAAVLLLTLLLALFPAKYYYLVFFLPLVFAAAAAAVAERRVHWAVLACAGVLYIGAISTPVRSLVISATLPPEQRLAANEAVLRRLIEPGSEVLASEFWASLADRVRYRSLNHGNPDMNEIDYVVLVSNGAGAPGRTQWIRPTQASALGDFEVIYDNLPHDVPRLAGLPLSHSGWGFGMRVLRRRAQ